MALHISSEMTVTSAPVSMLRETGFPSRHKVTAHGSPFLAGSSRALEMALLIAFPADGILGRTMSLIMGRDLATPGTLPWGYQACG